MDLAYFGIQKLGLFLLILVRTAGIFTLTPIFGSQQVPAQIRIMVALALTMVFVPMVGTSIEITMEPMNLALLVIREAFIGLTIGFICNMIFVAIEIAGDFIDLQAGFSFATMLDPVNGAQSAIATRIHRLLAGLLFFVTDAYIIMIRGVADSFIIAPVGHLVINPLVAGGIWELFTSLLVISLRIAMPIVGAVLLADIALAVTARIMPQMNVLIVGLPLKLGVGMVGMIIAMPTVVAMCQGIFGDMYNQMHKLVVLLTTS